MPPAIPDKIPCDSIRQLEEELGILRETLSYEETEETWDRIARALTRFGAIVKGGGYKFERELIHGVKGSAEPIVSALNSERTRLSAAALECITIIAPRIGLAFEPLVPLFITPILRLATRSNKVYVTRSQATLGLILGFCHIPSIIPHLLAACKDSKIVTGRAIALEGVLRCLNKWDWAQRDIRNKVGVVEEIIRITGRDKDAGIRQTSRKVFEAYKTLFPERIEEFTGPLTPVMRKYLDIKTLPHGQKPMERIRLLSAAEKPKRPQPRQDLSASTSSVPSSTTNELRLTLGARGRSASSNAVATPSSTEDANPHPANVGSMPPPAIVPNHARGASHSRVQSRTGHQQEGHVRQRVLSTTSTYSTQSAPPDSQSSLEHRPPMRLVNSQSHSSRTNPVVIGSSGQARRVRTETPVEPHPANCPDPMGMAHKAPVRPTHPPNGNAPRVFKAKRVPAREAPSVEPSVPSNTTGVVFPTSDSTRAVPVERKGAQRVPKPVASTPAAAPTSPPKAERPAVSLEVVSSRREVKPSIFRRGVAGVSGAGPKDIEKDGFAPRRGGGVTQPTLSQLSKQKAPASVTSSVSHAGPKTARAPAASNRPAWGAGGAPKTVPTRGLPVTRGRGRGGVTRAQTPKLADKPNIVPAMVPLPASPDCEGEVVPQMDPQSAFSESIPSNDKQTDEVPHADEETAEEVPEVTVKAVEVEGVVVSTVAEEVVDAPTDPEHADIQAEEHLGAAQAPVQNAVTEVKADAVVSKTPKAEILESEAPKAPRTPPFPPSNGDSDEDELEDIEFTTRDAYAPGGIPIKTPRKLGVLATDNVPERSPLGEVVLNA